MKRFEKCYASAAGIGGSENLPGEADRLPKGVIMQTKIHNLKPYTPAEIESFRARMEAEKQRQEEYREAVGGSRMVGAVILFVLALVLIGAVISFCWGASDRLVGLG